MYSFYKHEAQQEGDTCTVVLYLQAGGLAEFSSELGDSRQDYLEQEAISYVKQKFPSFPISTIKIMAGTALVTAVALGGTLPAQAAGKAPAKPVVSVKGAAAKPAVKSKAPAAGKPAIAASTGIYALKTGGRSGSYQVGGTTFTGTETYAYNGVNYRITLGGTFLRNPHAKSPVTIQGKASGTYTILAPDGTVVAARSFQNTGLVLHTNTKAIQLPLVYDTDIQAYLAAQTSAPAADTTGTDTAAVPDTTNPDTPPQ